MQKWFNLALNNKWFINDKKQLCDEHHNIIAQQATKYLTNVEIQTINHQNCLCNAISPFYQKKGIKLSIPFLQPITKITGLLTLYLVKVDQDIKCNCYFVDFYNDIKNLDFIATHQSIDNTWVYFSNQNNDQLNNCLIGKWIFQNFSFIAKPFVFNHVRYQEMNLEQFLSQSIKFLKTFVQDNPSIIKIPKFQVMLNWKEKE